MSRFAQCGRDTPSSILHLKSKPSSGPRNLLRVLVSKVRTLILRRPNVGLLSPYPWESHAPGASLCLNKLTMNLSFGVIVSEVGYTMLYNISNITCSFVRSIISNLVWSSVSLIFFLVHSISISICDNSNILQHPPVYPRWSLKGFP